MKSTKSEILYNSQLWMEMNKVKLSYVNRYVVCVHVKMKDQEGTDFAAMLWLLLMAIDNQVFEFTLCIGYS